MSSACSEDKPAGRLIFLGVAYNEAGMSMDAFNYAPDNFTRLFKIQSEDLFGEFKHDALKGARATHDAVISGMRNTGKMLKPEDLVVFYWGTHGGTDKKGWGANLPGNGVIYGRELKTELAAFPCPAWNVFGKMIVCRSESQQNKASACQRRHSMMRHCTT